MEIRIPPDVKARLVETLRKAGRREAGGILMGENLAPNCFRIVEFSASSRGGFAYFVRNLVHVFRSLQRFFERTGHQYRRFNYLGEWHSHPSFVLEPSTTDRESMLQIVQDTDVGATFAVLLIVRLGENAAIEGTATVFLPVGSTFQADLLWEDGHEASSC